jgi:hypothetical protein
MTMVPEKVRVGDLVCVMYGCETPFVLRRKGSRAFEFLGHSSVYGFDFDSAVAESKFRRRQTRPKKAVSFSTVDASAQVVDTTLKRTRNFVLV